MTKIPERKKRSRPDTDLACGIRTIVQIENLPVKELSDEEICKLFFMRFDATALVMLYEDRNGDRHAFGRLWSRKGIFERYRSLSNWIHGLSNHLLGFPWEQRKGKGRGHNIKSLDNETF